MIKKFLLALIMSVMMACSGMASPQSPSTPARDQIRAGVVLVATVVKKLDHACAVVATGMANEDPDFHPSPDATLFIDVPGHIPFVKTGVKLDAAIALAKKCDAAYEVARDALIAAENTLDAYDATKAKEIGCLMSKALTAVDSYVAALKDAGVISLPPEVADARSIGKALAALAGSECPIGAHQ